MDHFSGHNCVGVVKTELARLVQASEVPQDLDPVEIARSEDRWSWSVSLPMQVEKLWADLQAVRKQVARAGATNARASAEAAKGKQVAFVRDEGLQRELQCFCRRLLFPAFTTTLSTLNAGAIRSVPLHTKPCKVVFDSSTDKARQTHHPCALTPMLPQRGRSLRPHGEGADAGGNGATV